MNAPQRASRISFHFSFFTFHSSRDLLAFAILLLITLAFFWPMILTGKWIPHGGGDLVSFLWPQYSFAAQSIRSGSIPLWNPYLYSGAPFLADNQAGALYPINLIAFVLFPNFTYQVMEGLVVFHIWLAGAAMYIALRVWPTDSLALSGRGLGRGSALLGAIAYMLSDVFVTHIGNLNLIAVAAWMPLVLGLFACGLAQRDARHQVASGVIFAVAILAGHAQMTAITLVGLMSIVVWQFLIASSWRDRGKVIGLSAITLVVAFGLTAMQLLPSLEMTRYSLRSGLSYEEATAYSLPPAALTSLFSPLLFGRGAIDFWGPWQRVETGYLGVVPLLLMGFAFTRKKSNSAWFLAALGLLGLLIALGKYTPAYSLVHSLPVLGGLRVPARFILLTDFAIAALAALGLRQLLANVRSNGRWSWIGFVLVIGLIGMTLTFLSVPHAGHENNLTSALITFGGLVLSASAVIWWQKKSGVRNKRSEILLIGLLALELIVLGSTVEIDANDPTLGYQHQAVVDFLRADQNVFRVENTSSAWQSDAALMHGLNDIGGIFNPLGLANYETYRGGMGNRGSPLYNLLGVKYVLANKNEPPGDASFVPVFNADPQLDVYLNTKALPRAQLLDRAQIVQSGEAAWQAIHAADFDPSAMVVIEDGKDLPGGEDQSRQRSLSFASLTNDHVELIAQTSSPTYLVLTDVYYPGWTATIDDQPTDLYPADFAFQAVLVPAGSHRVRFQFEPIAWRWGLRLSGITGAGLLVWFGLRRTNKVASRR